ncbi:MAG TPA: hypothetical protein VLQ45_00045 [Thermoanaerobaculia bacterium]|nr:hypothetical protein [Thermoanaerobaculia bacterium]
MALFAAGLPISALGVVAKDLWTAVAFISIATACHQAWSATASRRRHALPGHGHGHGHAHALPGT